MPSSGTRSGVSRCICTTTPTTSPPAATSTGPPPDTPRAGAVAFGPWNQAHRLVERGAQTTLWQAAALGLLACVDEFLAATDDRRLTRSPTRSGAPATAVSQPLQSACSTAARTATGSDMTASRRSTPPAQTTLSTSSRGRVDVAPGRETKWKRTVVTIRLHDAMIRRGLLTLGALYVAAALIGHARERTGVIACGCREDCWCKRPGLSAVRWVFPFRHASRVS